MIYEKPCRLVGQNPGAEFQITFVRPQNLYLPCLPRRTLLTHTNELPIGKPFAHNLFGENCVRRKHMTMFELTIPEPVATGPISTRNDGTSLDTVNLPTDLYQRFLQLFDNTPGWFYHESAGIWDTLLSYQEATNNIGNMLEIGVYQGKSAGMLALHRRGEESCVLVDVLPLTHVRHRIEQAVPDAKCEYLQEMSQFLLRHPFVREAARDFRWIHIDGEHSAQAVSNDLALAETLLSDRGIIVLDDFFSPCYPQITQALFRFLEANPGRLT